MHHLNTQLIQAQTNHLLHRLWTPNEGINQRNLKFWANVANKIYFGRTYKFGIRIWFSNPVKAISSTDVHSLSFSIMSGKFKFQIQDRDLEYLFWRFDKHIAFSEKKLPLIISYHIQSGPKAFKLVRIGCAIKQ